MLLCPICKQTFNENEENGYEEFSIHVNECCAEASMKKKTEEMKKINVELEALKKAKYTYVELKKAFEKKYPDVYRANFPEEFCVCKDDCNDEDEDPNEYIKAKELTEDEFLHLISGIIKGL